MTRRCQFSLTACVALGSLLVMLPALLDAAPPAKADQAKATDKVTGSEAVDVFDAMKADQIGVKLIALNPHKANLVIENKTKKPLTIKLPDAVAAMPVLAQIGVGADPAQGLGGGAPGGPFNIAPEKTRKIELACLCLEHGKPDPHAKMAYELKPIASISDKPEVAALIARYGKGDIPAKAAQAAAWHLQNGMSWQELAAKELKHVRGPNEPYFTRAELSAATQLASTALAQTADERKETVSASDTSASKSLNP